jgi:serine O-acetyltransferase
MLINLYRIANKLYRHKIPILPQIIYYFQFLLFNSSVPPSVVVGKKTKFAYGGVGIVIHGRTVIGENCTLGQGITIGGKSKSINVPRIGNNVYLSAGCRILGDITIGDNSIVGANAVVVKDVPQNSIVAGVPAKVIKLNINISDYI